MATVAVIDNVKDCAEVLEAMLQWAGHGVHQFHGGQSFLDGFHSVKFQLILMDIVMPGMDGYELLGEVRKRDLDVPVIAVSAQTSKAYIERAYRAGFADFIPKPIYDLYGFRTMIAAHLQQGAMAVRG